MDIAQENWMFPCNVKDFDIVSHLKKSNTVVWKKRRGIQIGDYVYIYLGKPYSAIKYKCKVIKDDVDSKTVKENYYAIRESYDSRKVSYIMLELQETFSDDAFPLSEMKKNDINQVQIPVRLSQKALRFLQKG